MEAFCKGGGKGGGGFCRRKGAVCTLWPELLKLTWVSVVCQSQHL